ncbi:MAG: diphosphate--fructose-6-phosphate 1-phosphotransferase [Salinispira sp.]
MEISPLQRARYEYQPKLPPVFNEGTADIRIRLGEATESVSDSAEIQKLFKHHYGAPIAAFEKDDGAAFTGTRFAGTLRIGVILSGGQAPGGHNVITGLYDAMKAANRQSVLIGFMKGPGGLIDNECIVLDDDSINSHRNTGGFSIIGSGRAKIETPGQFASALKNAQAQKLNALVIIGGDDSNTNAAVLAEFFTEHNSEIQVIGVPKTIDGDLKNEYIEASFGFDTAVKTYSELIGNVMRDAASSKKYWHFIKLMGRSASHIALEAALQTHPNVAIISEEVAHRQTSLAELIREVADAVQYRAERGDNFGIALIPEGLIEFIPEVRALIDELNNILSHYRDYFATLRNFDDQTEFISSKLSDHSARVFSSLPRNIRRQLLLDRDPHGNVQVSLIDTEKLFIEMVGELLAERSARGAGSAGNSGSARGGGDSSSARGAGSAGGGAGSGGSAGNAGDSGSAEGGGKSGRSPIPFQALPHFFGYEGRSAFPSNFDADYTYSLGYTAFMLIVHGLNGYLSSVRNLHRPSSEWIAGGIPLTMLMNMEQRHGARKPVIRKALVELDGAPFREFAAHREQWARETSYRFPGAIQYYGPPEVCDQPTITLALEKGKP